MKTLITLLCAAAVCTTAFSQKELNKSKLTATSATSGMDHFVTANAYDGFLPLTPMVFTGNLPVWGKDTATTQNILRLVNTPRKLNKLLPDLSIVFSIKKYDNTGNATYGLTGVTAEEGSYEINYDVVKFTTADVSDPNGRCKTYERVGAGIRVTANITTFKSNLDVSNLVNLATSASKDERGGLSIHVFGIEGREVMGLIPSSNTTIENNSINALLQAIGIIKYKLYDDAISLVPRIFAVQHMGCSTEKPVALTQN